jgi:acyl-CoA thioester hydrolase
MSRSQFAFFHPLRVRYSEVDSQGYVFNANHVNYFQTGLTEYFRDLDYDHAKEAPEADFHTVRVVLDIKGPVGFDQEVDLGVRAARVGKSSITWGAALFPRGGDQELTSGEIVWVNVDQTKGRSSPLPDKLIAQLKEREVAIDG